MLPPISQNARFIKKIFVYHGCSKNRESIVLLPSVSGINEHFANEEGIYDFCLQNDGIKSLCKVLEFRFPNRKKKCKKPVLSIEDHTLLDHAHFVCLLLLRFEKF